jgi:hypothetical protein
MVFLACHKGRYRASACVTPKEPVDHDRSVGMTRLRFDHRRYETDDSYRRFVDEVAAQLERLDPEQVVA